MNLVLEGPAREAPPFDNNGYYRLFSGFQDLAGLPLREEGLLSLEQSVRVKLLAAYAGRQAPQIEANLSEAPLDSRRGCR